MYNLKTNILKRNLILKVPVLKYSVNSLPKIKVKYDKDVQKKLKQIPELQQNVDQLLSKPHLIDNLKHYKHFYNISSISNAEAKNSYVYKSSVLIQNFMENEITTKNVFVNDADEQHPCLNLTFPGVKPVLDEQFDIKLGTTMSYLCSEGYHFQAYNIKLNENSKKTFVVKNNDIIGEATGMHSRYIKFEAKNMSMSEKDAYIVQFFKSHLKDVYHSPDFNNFLKTNKHYFVIKNSQLLLFSRDIPFSKNYNKAVSKIFNNLKPVMDIFSNKNFYYLDIQANTISSATLIKSLLSKTFTYKKEKFLNSVIMTTRSNDDVVNCLTSYSPSKEYSMKMIELLDADLKDEYAAEIRKLMEHDTNDIINKLQLIARTEPEIHHMTSILSNFKDVEFTCVLTVYLWKTLAKLKSIKPTSINYDKCISNLNDDSLLNVPDLPTSNGVNINVFTDASLKNETSATAQVYFVNNTLAYMQSSINNNISSYIDTAELHAAVSAMDQCQVIKSMIKDFLEVEQEINTTIFIDNTYVLNAISLHEKKVYEKTSVKNFDFLISSKYEGIDLRYVPTLCNIADGLTKVKFNRGLYSSIWLRQFSKKKVSDFKSQFELIKSKYAYVNKTIDNFKKMIKKTKKQFNSLREMEELYEKHTDDIIKKERILTEIKDISTRCLIELRATDKYLQKKANKYNIVLETKNEGNGNKDFDIAMEALSKEVNYDKGVQMIASELGSMKINVQNEKKVPADFKRALNSRNNILNLWEISIEEKINEISEYFNHKERLKFKTINDKYESMKRLQEQRDKRYQEWKEYLKNKENQNSEEESKDLLHKLVESNINMISREEREKAARLEALEEQQNLEKKRIANELALKESFKSTLKSMIECNNLNEASQRITLEKQQEMDKIFADLEKKVKKCKEARRVKQAKNATAVKQKSHNPEVNFDNIHSFTIGYPFDEHARITKGATLTTRQQAKLKSVVQIQQLDVLHKRQEKARKRKLEIMARKKRIQGRLNDLYLEGLMKNHQRRNTGMF